MQYSIELMAQEIPCVSCSETIKIGKESSTLGYGTETYGLTSFASGYQSIAQGDYATAFGYKARAIGIASIAAGYDAIANGKYSVSLGLETITGHMGAVAIGFGAEADNVASIAIGKYIKTIAPNAITFGSGYNSQLLENPLQGTMMIGFNSTAPTFFVSESPDGGNKTGKIGIGNVTNPLAKLHIKSDASENATLFLQPNDWDDNYAELRMGTSENLILAKKDTGLIFKTENNYLFNSPDARFGIGVDNPSAKLEVNGNILQTSGFHATPQIKAPDNDGLMLTDDSGNGIFVEDGGNVVISTDNSNTALNVNGTVNADYFIGDGSLLTDVPGDHLGNHTATQNIKLNNKYLSGDGGNEGIFVNAFGKVGIGT
ncbi:MAG: hypothetical protein B6I19_06470 [Bacteroidetes bacterium 4572_114]|nr:MAG: hypothetical protein B6I19_06470 [Bacteroidetes bacterium 4572_114]